MEDTSPTPRRRFLQVSLVCVAIGVLLFPGYFIHISMPGHSHEGALPPLTAPQAALATDLERHVRVLAEQIGERDVDWQPEALDEAARYIEAELADAGYTPQSQTFDTRGRPVRNIAVELPGSGNPEEIVVVGAHYDTRYATPGADDNASGTAALLALARHLRASDLARTVRFVAFTNEEPPNFQRETMGSLQYAQQTVADGDPVVAMFSLESIGYYRDEPGSQAYPFPFSLLYPSTGDFIGFVGNPGSRSLVRQSVRLFREHAAFPSQGAAIPGQIPGVGWSDHWSFWQVGVPAVMVTDTAPNRNPNYHEPTDTVLTVDFERMARVVEGLAAVIEGVASE